MQPQLLGGEMTDGFLRPPKGSGEDDRRTAFGQRGRDVLFPRGHPSRLEAA